MTVGEFVKQARALRSASLRAEVDFLEFLRLGEGNEKTWRETGALTYEAFLRDTDLCEPARYRNYARARETVDLEVAREIGAHAIVRLGRVESPSARADAVVEMQTFVATNGTTVSEQTAATIVRDTNTRAAATKAGHRSYATLLADLERARREIERLRMVEAALRAELKAAKRGKVIGKKPTPGRAAA